MSEQKNIGTDFIQKLIDNKTDALIYLHRGIRLHGIIVDQGTDGVILEESGKQQLVMKAVISTIAPR